MTIEIDWLTTILMCALWFFAGYFAGKASVYRKAAKDLEKMKAQFDAALEKVKAAYLFAMKDSKEGKDE